MKVYTFSETPQELKTVFDVAQLEGGVRIALLDGRTFLMSPEKEKSSPLDVKGVSLNFTREEIISAVREVREHKGCS